MSTETEMRRRGAAKLTKARHAAQRKSDRIALLQAAVMSNYRAARPCSEVDILGIDPGSHAAGWATLRAHRDEGSVTWLAGKHSSAKAIEEMIPVLRALSASFARGLVVAIEIPEWTPVVKDATALFETLRMAESLAALAEMVLGRPVVRLRALDWKLRLGLRVNANDAQVKPAIVSMVREVPRTNVHVRDAAGVALAATKLLGLGWRSATGKVGT